VGIPAKLEIGFQVKSRSGSRLTATVTARDLEQDFTRHQIW